MWVDVKPTIPAPVQAHDADSGRRHVEARLWFVVADQRPFKLKITLREDASLVEVWENDYSGRIPSDAIRGYASAKAHAERWLEGWPVSQVRPRFR